MFDAKSLLEALVTGGRQQSAGHSGGQSGGDSLGDLLGQVLGQSGHQRTPPQTGGQHTADQPRGLGDIFGNVLPGGGQGGSGGQSGGGAGGLGDILGELQRKGGEGAGGIADILGQVLGQASQGVKEGAGKVNDATGAGDAIGGLVRELSGKSPDEIMKRLQEFANSNQLGTGAALGGLGALIFGTQTGRSVAVGAAKIGALALIGGLAYKAYQNYQSGKPLIDSGNATAEAAPRGSGFEPDAVDNDNAALLIHTMLAAAAADGRVDASEQERILGSLKQAGMDQGAEEFIANALNNPPSIDDIASRIRTREEAVQVYTAARIAIEPDTSREASFLAQLADRLGIEPELAGHIDAAARSNMA